MFVLFYKKMALIGVLIMVFSGINISLFADDFDSNEKIEFVRQLIRTRYIDEISKEILQKEDIDEIFENLDKYSEYMTVDKSNEFMDAIDLQYEGIGVKVEKVEQALLLTSVFEDGGAYDSGLEAGDLLLEVDGESMEELTLNEAVSLIRGDEGTFVDLVVLKDDSLEYIDISVERRKLNAPIVDFKRLGGNIGYIRLYSFGKESASEISQAIDKLGNVNYYIFDLRNNSGGYRKASKEVLGFFSDVEKALIERQRNGEDRVYFSFRQDKSFEKDVITLINKYSASASEIVAGAISDYSAGVLYGQRTFGKGSVQSTFEIRRNNGDIFDMIKLTTSRFLSPNGTVIDENGIKPDVETKEGKELLEAHSDLLERVYANYNKLPLLERGVETKSFEVRLTESIEKETLDKKFKIVNIGGKRLDIGYEKISEDRVRINLNEELKEDNEYILYIHPGIEGKSGSILKQGYSVKISTES